MPIYILDTNAVRYLVNPTFTSDDQRTKLQERGHEGTLAVKYTPIVNFELASQIESSKQDFPVIREAVRTLLNMRAEALPDFEHRMWEIVSDTRMPSSMYRLWQDMMECIAKAPDVEALNRGYDDLTTATHRAVYTKFAADFRDDYEQHYRMSWATALRSIVPDFDKRVAKGKMINLAKDEVNRLDAFLQGPEWHAAILNILAYRGKALLPRRDYEISTILHKARYFQEGFEWLIRKAAKDGLHPHAEKRKNDYNDIHQLLYVNDYSDNVLVSQDAEFLEKVSCLGTKVIHYTEFVAREANA